MPTSSPKPSPATPGATAPADATSLDPSEDVARDVADRIRYLDEVMAEIDAEVRRRRASGDLPAGLEAELDELFLEFSPVGLHGRARLRETLALVDGSAYVDIAVPTASNKAVGSYVKQLIRKGLGWYMNFVVAQIVKFAWSVSRMFHVVVDHIEDLETAVESTTTPDLPADAVPEPVPGPTWWAPTALSALAGATDRVLVADCGDGALLDTLVAAGVDAYGVDPSDLVLEPALARGLDVRAEGIVDHLGVVAREALGGMVLTGSLQWLRPNQRQRLLELVTSRLAPGGTVVLHSTTPEGWAASVTTVTRDLAPGHPLHAETWAHLLGSHGFAVADPVAGGADRSLPHVGPGAADADTLNAAIDALNQLLLGPTEYVVVATRER